MESKTGNDIIPMKHAILIIVLILIAVPSILLIISQLLFAESPFFAKDDSADAAGVTQQIEGNADIADFLDGTWIMEVPNNNGETMSITFLGNSYTTTTEMVLIAEYDYIVSEVEEMEAFYGGSIAVRAIDNESVLIHITADGIFSFTENEINLTGTTGITKILPFSIEQNSIIMNDDVFIRQIK